MNIKPLFCKIDDFLQVYEKQIVQRQLPIPDQPNKSPEAYSYVSDDLNASDLVFQNIHNVYDNI